MACTCKKNTMLYQIWKTRNENGHTSINALSCMVTLSFLAPSSSISCNGSSTFSIPSMLCSPKYKRLASSSASCQSIATLISSCDTSCACFFLVVVGVKERGHQLAQLKETLSYIETKISTRSRLLA